MLRRREEHRLSQDLIAALGGPSDTKIGELERGTYASATMRAVTLRKIDKGLGWAPGSAERVARGGEPTPLPGWPFDLVSDLRAVIAHNLPGADEIPEDHRRQIVALYLRLERGAVERGSAGPDPGANNGGQPGATPGPTVDELLDRHRKAMLDQFEQLRNELHGLRPGEDD